MGLTLVERANPLLSMSFDESPAIVWIKDLDGRYLIVNRRYTEVLGTPAAQLLGRTDMELAPRAVVDGPLLQDGAPAITEPLQFRYTVGPFEGRPALAALRFPVCNRSNVPVAVCGVAAPLADAEAALDECMRLIAIEQQVHRTNRNEPHDFPPLQAAG